MTFRRASLVPPAVPLTEAFAGLDLLSTAVMLLDEERRILHLNPAAENLFSASLQAWNGRHVTQLPGSPAALAGALDNALERGWSHTAHDIIFHRDPATPLHLDCTVTPTGTPPVRLLLEFRSLDRQIEAAREERIAVQQQASRELIRNLAHEIKNPLGGIRGSAQLLERELDGHDHAARLKEYTRVIIDEADRLQDLMRRLLSSHCVMQPATANIHELLERVRRLIHAEFPEVDVRGDYDLSLPEIACDRERLIQAVLNVARNAAQAITRPPSGEAKGGEIVLRTRVARQVTLAKKRHPLALELQVIDDGPGIPEELRERIFYPLVSGREGGSGLGLALAQGIVQQHQGAIEVGTSPGHTCFTIRLPLGQGQQRNDGATP